MNMFLRKRCRHFTLSNHDTPGPKQFTCRLSVVRPSSYSRRTASLCAPMTSDCFAIGLQVVKNCRLGSADRDVQYAMLTDMPEHTRVG